MADDEDWGTSPVFRIKLALIAVAILNTFFFHGRTVKSIQHWNQHRPAPLGGKVAAIVSLTLWTATIAAGRLLAYF
ncbi:MAG: hypothetical protein ACT4P5_12460 [Armatimonadota bacterium]